mmetsp:Transcript_101306/g.180047  ORF Transcript_101306/g.180047 Transcript_101306/m.180047 type:complete len:327 (+) Transcript_101306:382-1362(+)
MSADLPTSHMVIDAAVIVLKVREHGEGHLHGPASHDGLLNACLTRCCDNLALEGVLIGGEVVVRRLGISVTGLGSRSRVLLGRASWLALCWVGVVLLRSMMMAVRKLEVAAKAFAERSGALVLPAAHSSFASEEATLLQVGPWAADLASIAALGHHASPIEAHVLGRQRHHHRCVGRDAHAIRCSFCARKGPAASAIGLVTNVADELGALRPVLLGVELFRNGQVLIRNELVDLAEGNHLADVLLLVTLYAVHVLRSAWSRCTEPLIGHGLPEDTRGVLNLLNLGQTIRMDVLCEACGYECGGCEELHGTQAAKTKGKMSVRTLEA